MKQRSKKKRKGLSILGGFIKKFCILYDLGAGWGRLGAGLGGRRRSCSQLNTYVKLGLPGQERPLEGGDGGAAGTEPGFPFT